jgi:hypothetical protein
VAVVGGEGEWFMGVESGGFRITDNEKNMNCKKTKKN